MPSVITDYVPQFVPEGGVPPRTRAGLLAWGITLLAASLFVALILLAPLLRARGAMAWSQIIYMALGSLCHQMPERSFQFEGFPLAVCARCWGLYVGALAGLLLYPFVRSLSRTDAPPRAWLFLAALPSALDFLLGISGAWENTHASRFLTALLLGGVAAFYVVPGLVDLSSQSFRQFFGNLYSNG